MRILGIDLGSSSLKAVEIDSAFGRYEIHDYHDFVIPSSIQNQEQLSQLVSQFITGLKKQPDRIVVSLRTNDHTLRNLKVPTRDKKAIQTTVGFELEDELPFASDHSCYEFVILSQSKQGSMVHINATLKSNLRASLEFWKSAQVDPDVITSDTWAYRNLLNRIHSPQDQAGPLLLVQVGREKTILYLQEEGTPLMIREMDWGGRAITQAIAKRFGITEEEAESTKLDRGSLALQSSESEFTAEQLDLMHTIEGALEPLVQMIRHSQLTSRSTTRKPIQKLLLSGGTSLLPGFAQWLQANTKIPSDSVLALSSMSPSGVVYSEQTDARFLLAAALAFSVVGPNRAQMINFRKGEFAKVGQGKKLDLKVLRKPLMALSTVGLSLFFSLMIQSSVYQSRLKTTNVALEKAVKGFFGAQVSNSALRTYLSDTTTLKTSIEKELTKNRELARLYGANPRSPLGFLNQLSTIIPRDLVVDLAQLQVGIPTTDSYTKAEAQTFASMTFLVSSPPVAERLTQLLSKRFSPLQRSKMDENESGGSPVKKWKITLSGKPTEDSYGK